MSPVSRSTSSYSSVWDMTEQEVKNVITGVLRGWCFEVEQIPEGSTPTPDLLASGDLRYAIEIKTKEDDPSEVSERQEALRRGEIVDLATPFVPRNTLSGILRDGVKQLRSLATERRDLSLLWLIAVGADQMGKYEQFRSTLYGLTNVVGPDNNSLIRCYYLRDSAFFRWRTDLDGAVISTLKELEFCINSYSPRADALARSDLAARFGVAVVSPSEEERQGQAYVADCDIDRRDEQAILRFLAEKYGRSALMTFGLGAHSAYLELPTE